MLRVAIVVLILGLDGGAGRDATAAWPHRAVVTGIRGERASFRTVTLGGEVAVSLGGSETLPQLGLLAQGDTLRAFTPADLPMNLRNGPVVFLATGTDSIEVTVGRNPHGQFERVTARGRLVTVRLVNDRAILEPR